MIYRHYEYIYLKLCGNVFGAFIINGLSVVVILKNMESMILKIVDTDQQFTFYASYLNIESVRINEKRSIRYIKYVQLK